jgi:HEAT repeat protein
LYIFISYARSDGSDAATHVLTELARSQISAWMDGRNLDPFHDFTAEIEDAIERASHIAVCITQGSKRDDSFVRREIQYAIISHKPIVPLRLADIPPHIQIVTIPFIDLFPDWDSGFAEFLHRLGRPPQGQEFATPASDPFRQHLERLNDYILDELRRTLLNPEGVLQLRASGVANARFRALPVAYRSSRPSWFQTGEQSEREFASFPEAFEHLGRRVILLGEPGGGKTTTLLAFAREAVSCRLADANALLPVYVPIRTWDGTSELLAWMAAAADLDSEALRTAVDSGQALLLLDGLDELRRISLRTDTSEDPRLAFLRAAAELGHTPMVITCRQAEYEQMAASPAASVDLEAIVRLQPLTDDQIAQYLNTSPQLLATLHSDETLRRIARNPLILTLLAMAYRDESLNADDLDDLADSPADARTRIFSGFVERRYEFEVARLDEGMKPSFTLDEVYEGLGAQAMGLLDPSQRVTIEIGEDDWSVSQRDGTDGKPAELVEMDVRSFRRQLGPAALSFVALAERLGVVVPARRGAVRFTHLLMRDHFAFEEARRRLRQSDPAGRRSAVGVLGLIGDRRALPQLHQALEDSDDTVKALAIWALGEIGDPAAVEPLLAVIRGIERPNLASLMLLLAVEALGKLGDRAVEPLRQLLIGEGEAFGGADERDSGFAKQTAAQSLGRIGAAAVPALIGALEDPDAFFERGDVMAALGAGRDPRAFEPLLAAVRSRGWLSWEGITALGSLGDPRAIPFLMTVDDGVYQREALDAIASIGGPEALNGLLAALRDRKPERRSQAALSLGMLAGAEVKGPLEAALDDPDLRVRIAAADSLERLGYDSATLRARQPSTAELLAALVHADSAIRAEAARQLGRRQDPQVADALADAMADKDTWVARTAQMALASLGDSRAAPRLGVRLFKFDEWDSNEIDQDVAEALGTIPDSGAARLLIDASDDEDDRAHPSVMTAIVAIGEPAVPPLLEALREPDPRFRSILRSALAAIGVPAVSPILQLLRSEDPRMEAVAGTLSQIGTAAVPALLDALADPSLAVQAAAARALGSIDDDRAARPLVSLLEQASDDVRTTAAMALADLGEPAVKPLVEVLRRGSLATRAAAATILGEIGAGEALQPLLEALTDPEPLVRRNAITQLPLLREPGMEPRMRLVLDDAHLGVRLAAVQALKGTLDEDLLSRRQPSVDELLAALDEPDPQLRADVIPWLATAVTTGSTARAAGLERLIRALADTDVRVQMSAARNLASLGVVDPLLKGLEARDEPTRMVCATALAADEEAGAESLRLLLRHDQPATRRWAAKILGARHDAGAVPGLITLLLDKDIPVREEATDALVTMPEHSGEKLVELFIDDHFGPPAAEVVRRMGEVAVQPMIELLDAEDERVRAHVLAILTAIGRPAVKPLVDVLQPSSGTEGTRRVGAVEVLGKIRHRRGLAAIIAALKDKHIEVQLAAIRALGESRDQWAIAALKNARRRRQRAVKDAVRQALAEVEESSASADKRGH